ncbi:ABC transporter ATP-binding protein [Candidatus Acetothermia bacterium]|nr:MAG: ABC transporter ATP-binding protein [Candidatus Acetothermia bacterium]
MAVVEAIGLRKAYRDAVAVDGLDISIEEREIYGLLGPNGSGKTTTILLLLGLTEPSSGTIRVLGRNPWREGLAVKRQIGYLPENVGFYDDLTARENLRFVARLNRIPDRESAPLIDDALGSVGLGEVADRPVRTYSRGMRQRLGIAEVLLKEPRLAILDEPTSGIDPEGATQILDLIVRMRNDRGMTVLLSSHLLHQVQRVCDRVGILHRGRLVAEGTLDQLSLSNDLERAIEIRARGLDPDGIEAIRAIEGVIDVEARGDWIRVRGNPPDGALARAVVESNGELIELRGATATLEDVYLRYFQE